MDNEIITRRNTHMAYTILSESYGRRLPKITAEADSTEDLTALGTDYAEGSTCNVGETEYTLDKVSGWIVPGSGGGGGSGGGVLVATFTYDPTTETTTCDKTYVEIHSQFQSGTPALFRYAEMVDGEAGVIGSGVMSSNIYEETTYYIGSAVIYRFTPEQGNLPLEYVACDISASEVTSQRTHIPTGQ